MLSRSSVDMGFVASKLLFLFIFVMAVCRGEEGKLVKNPVCVERCKKKIM